MAREESTSSWSGRGPSAWSGTPSRARPRPHACSGAPEASSASSSRATTAWHASMSTREPPAAATTAREESASSWSGRGPSAWPMARSTGGQRLLDVELGGGGFGRLGERGDAGEHVVEDRVRLRRRVHGCRIGGAEIAVGSREMRGGLGKRRRRLRGSLCFHILTQCQNRIQIPVLDADTNTNFRQIARLLSS